jgi:cyclophilin family peptidyl-prolyl cis-trans isomerase/HEAT repeat protein
MRKFIIFGLIGLATVLGISAQVHLNTAITLAKAEDARRYDRVVAGLLGSPNAHIRIRAALAAGRIGDPAAVPVLADLLANDPSNEVRSVAAFAIGEIESIDGAEAVLKHVSVALPADQKTASDVIARSLEAAGKIAAANPRDSRSRELGAAIVGVLKAERSRGDSRDRLTVLLGLTALLRAIPVGAEAITAEFLNDADGRIRADAGNTLARIRATNANERLRQMVVSDDHPEARANAARALAVGEDVGAASILTKAAMTDSDSRVRVAAIRSLATLKAVGALQDLKKRADELYEAIARSTRPGYIAIDKSEFLELATAIGRLAQSTKDDAAYRLLSRFAAVDKYISSEIEVALARLDPDRYISEAAPNTFRSSDHRAAAAYGQGLAEIAALKNDDLNSRAGQRLVMFFNDLLTKVPARQQNEMMMSLPSLSRSLAALKPDNIRQILTGNLTSTDVQVRAAAAELLSNMPSTPETLAALNDAFMKSLVADRDKNDAQLAILEAIFKLDKAYSLRPINEALSARDHLVRRRAITMLNDQEAWKDGPTALVEQARAVAARGDRDTVWRHAASSRTRMGQVLNSEADYRRALSRKNGSVRAIITTAKGAFTIDLLPEDAPLTVDNFIKLARRGYFNGLAVHRVVPNFVMQDGDPRGDGSGGPGWTIRCEMNMVPYDRGAVGMALSGKDTGGSQWFVTHSRQPHLDGGYTVFGKVNDADMKVVDNIVRGDKIIRIRIAGR